MKTLVAALALTFAAPFTVLAGDDAADIRATLQRFDKAYEALDASTIAGLFASDPDVAFFNSDVGERWFGSAAIKLGLSADMKRLKSIRIEGQPATVHVRGSLAWFERSMVMHTEVKEGESAIFSRATGVLEKRGGQWLLMQLHISVGAPRDSAPHD